MERITKTENSRRCANRTSRIAQYESLQKPCNPPQEYSHYENYQNIVTIEKVTPSISERTVPENFLLGTKIGKCDICKTTKKILLLNYGFNLCEDCINICTAILEQLPIDDTAQPPKKSGPDKQKLASLKQQNIA